MALTPAQLKAGAAGFGTGGTTGIHVHRALTRASVLQSLSKQSRRYVKAIMALTPAQLRAGVVPFGTNLAPAAEGPMIGSNWGSYFKAEGSMIGSNWGSYGP
jgi:hypothetical protein